VPSLCLILDFGSLFVGSAGLASDAVAMLGELKRLQSGLAQSSMDVALTLALADLDGKGFAQEVKKLCDVTDEPWRLIAAGAGPGAPCPGEPDETILLAAVPRPALPGVTTWVLGDAVHGPGSFEDVERRTRERLRIPVARPMSPEHRSGAVLALRAPAQDMVLRAAYRDAAVDWVEVEGTVLVYCENTDVEDWLIDLGAGRLTRSVRKGSLALQPAGAAAEALWRGKELALVSITEDAARVMPDVAPWSASRHRRLP
jgi:hypothetical protein